MLRCRFGLTRVRSRPLTHMYVRYVQTAQPAAPPLPMHFRGIGNLTSADEFFSSESSSSPVQVLLPHDVDEDGPQNKHIVSLKWNTTLDFVDVLNGITETSKHRKSQNGMFRRDFALDQPDLVTYLIANDPPALVQESGKSEKRSFAMFHEFVEFSMEPLRTLESCKPFSPRVGTERVTGYKQCNQHAVYGLVNQNKSKYQGLKIDSSSPQPIPSNSLVFIVPSTSVVQDMLDYQTSIFHCSEVELQHKQDKSAQIGTQFEKHAKLFQVDAGYPLFNTTRNARLRELLQGIIFPRMGYYDLNEPTNSAYESVPMYSLSVVERERLLGKISLLLSDNPILSDIQLQMLHGDSVVLQFVHPQSVNIRYDKCLQQPLQATYDAERTDLICDASGALYLNESNPVIQLQSRLQNIEPTVFVESVYELTGMDRLLNAKPKDQLSSAEFGKEVCLHVRMPAVISTTELRNMQLIGSYHYDRMTFLSQKNEFLQDSIHPFRQVVKMLVDHLSLSESLHVLKEDSEREKSLVSNLIHNIAKIHNASPPRLVDKVTKRPIRGQHNMRLLKSVAHNASITDGKMYDLFSRYCQAELDLLSSSYNRWESVNAFLTMLEKSEIALSASVLNDLQLVLCDQPQDYGAVMLDLLAYHTAQDPQGRSAALGVSMKVYTRLFDRLVEWGHSEYIVDFLRLLQPKISHSAQDKEMSYVSITPEGLISHLTRGNSASISNDSANNQSSSTLVSKRKLRSSANISSVALQGKYNNLTIDLYGQVFLHALSCMSSNAKAKGNAQSAATMMLKSSTIQAQTQHCANWAQKWANPFGYTVHSEKEVTDEESYQSVRKSWNVELDVLILVNEAMARQNIPDKYRQQQLTSTGSMIMDVEHGQDVRSPFYSLQSLGLSAAKIVETLGMPLYEQGNCADLASVVYVGQECAAATGEPEEVSMMVLERAAANYLRTLKTVTNQQHGKADLSQLNTMELALYNNLPVVLAHQYVRGFNEATRVLQEIAGSHVDMEHAEIAVLRAHCAGDIDPWAQRYAFASCVGKQVCFDNDELDLLPLVQCVLDDEESMQSFAKALRNDSLHACVLEVVAKTASKTVALTETTDTALSKYVFDSASAVNPRRVRLDTETPMKPLLNMRLSSFGVPVMQALYFSNAVPSSELNVLTADHVTQLNDRNDYNNTQFLKLQLQVSIFPSKDSFAQFCNSLLIDHTHKSPDSFLSTSAVFMSTPSHYYVNETVITQDFGPFSPNTLMDFIRKSGHTRILLFIQQFKKYFHFYPHYHIYQLHIMIFQILQSDSSDPQTKNVLLQFDAWLKTTTAAQLPADQLAQFRGQELRPQQARKLYQQKFRVTPKKTKEQ